MASPESSRARRFALPELHDERATDAIEAFLDGPEVRRHRPPARRRPPRDRTAVKANTAVVLAPDAGLAVAIRPSTDLRTIPGRLEFSAALERESVRAARYGRPASVAIVELTGDEPDQRIDPWLRTLAGPIARALRAGARATDLVARVATARFQVLLPETSEVGASRYAERVSSACRAWIESVDAPVAARVTIATATPEHSLQEALAHALASIEAA